MYQKALEDARKQLGLTNVIRQIALTKLGGCSVGKIRSHPNVIHGDSFGYYPNDVSEINNVFDVLTQSILLTGFDKRESNVKLANVLIEPDVSSFLSTKTTSDQPFFARW